MHALHHALLCPAHLDWGGWVFLFFIYYRSRLDLSVNIDRLFRCSPFPGFFTPSPYIYHTSAHIHTSVTSFMQLREGKVLTREPKDWSGLPRSEPPVTAAACFLSIGAKFPFSSLGHILPQTHINRVGFFHAFVAAFCFFLTILHAPKKNFG